MKKLTNGRLKTLRSFADTSEAIDYCLDRFYKDRKHRITEEIVQGLTFEEVIGALMLSRNTVKGLEKAGMKKHKSEADCT